MANKGFIPEGNELGENPIRTYRQLQAAISQMNDEQLDSNITVQDPIEEEFHPAELRIINGEECDVLDDNHPVIYIY